MNMRRLLLAVVTAIALTASLNACGEKLPNPVERRDGYAWIPMADTAFLIPEKTWLKGYGRRATDGLVVDIGLHATVPEVAPWSPEVQDQMYPPRGWGRLITIAVRDKGNRTFFQRFPDFPQSINGAWKLVEEPSELAAIGLHRFRELRVTDGKPQVGVVFYEHVQDGKVKYFVRCNDHGGKPGVVDSCNLMFPHGDRFEVTLSFLRAYMADSVRMADKVAEKLNEFELAGRARLTASQSK